MVEAAGIVFIGPSAENMRVFSLKHEARAFAGAEGVPMLPASPVITDRAAAADVVAAAGVAYPVIVKCTGGGGGIGMTVCRDAGSLSDAVDASGRAGAHFSDSRVFVEHYVDAAHHVEVQVFGDGAGHVVALGERECSVQRRHQKVVEETPCMVIAPATRAAMIAAAVKLASAAKYRSAGTVEFVYDEETAEFYFLEVNTRLQVEHGITELVAGVDLVEWMVRLAAGDEHFVDETLAHYVHNPRGHAIEARRRRRALRGVSHTRCAGARVRREPVPRGRNFCACAWPCGRREAALRCAGACRHVAVSRRPCDCTLRQPPR